MIMKFGVILSIGSIYQPVVVEVDDKVLNNNKPKVRLQIIQAAIDKAVIDQVVVIRGPVIRGRDDFLDSDFVIENASFGDATWAADDVRKALQDREYSTCLKNVRFVIENCSKIEDTMVDAGWNHIECVIDENSKSLVKAKKK